MAVSYTHLDVYKRQVEVRAEEKHTYSTSAPCSIKGTTVCMMVA